MSIAASRLAQRLNPGLYLAPFVTPLVTTFWRARAPRERILLALMVIFLLAFGLFSFWYQPLAAQRQALDQQRTTLRNQLHTMQTHLARRPSDQPAPTQQNMQQLVQVLPTLLARAGLDPAQVSLNPVSAQQLQLSLRAVSYQAALDALQQIANSSGLRVTYFSATPKVAPTTSQKAAQSAGESTAQKAGKNTRLTPNLMVNQVDIDVHWQLPA